MPFKVITCKLGTMRKADEWVLNPQDTATPHLLIIQCEKRIARVDLTTGKAFLSDGKGGHPGFHKLSPQLGAVVVDVPTDILDRLKALVAKVPQFGPVVLDGRQPVISG